MDRLVRMFHSGFVKENGEFENMNELVESFNDRSTYKDLFDRVMQKYGCGFSKRSKQSHRMVHVKGL
jgi:hypothetical protein